LSAVKLRTSGFTNTTKELEHTKQYCCTKTAMAMSVMLHKISPTALKVNK